jgi:HPt (histidine-containing phosphotransfer) domain-containing protein
MDDYISKPVDVQEMVAKIEMLASRRLRSPQSRSAKEEVPMLNIEESLRRMGGDRSLLIATAEFFLDDAPGLLRSLKDSLATGDAKTAERAVHSLKSLAANFGATTCVNLAELIEGLAAAQDLRAAASQMAALEARFEKLQVSLSELIASDQPV